MGLKHIFLLYITLTFGCVSLFAQGSDSSTKRMLDHTRPGFADRIQEFAKKEARQSIEDLKADRASIAQYHLLEQIRLHMQKAKLYLRNGIDTGGIRRDLNAIHANMVVAGDGVFTNKGTAQTFRNLSATSKILSELFNQANVYKTRLESYNNAVNDFRYRLDSLSANPSMFEFPKDSVASLKYLTKLRLVAIEIHPVDSQLKVAGNNVEVLLNDLSLTTLELQNSLDEISDYRRAMAGNVTEREFNSLWDNVGFARPFRDIINYSIEKDILTLKFYTQDNRGELVALLILVLTSFVYLRSLKMVYKENGLLDAGYNNQLVLRHPLLSAIVIVVNLFQFVFVSPPFLWSFILWSISALSLSLLFRTFITRHWMMIWLTMVLFFFLAGFDNLILQASRTERWLMLFLSTIGCIVGGLVSLYGDKDKLREKWIVYSIGLMSFMQLCSTIANALGRYNLSKSLMTAGFLNVVIAIMFLWTIRLIDEGMQLALNVYSKQDRKLFYLNFQKMGGRAPAIFYVMLIIGWFVLVGRNFPAFEYLAEPISNFFAEERSLGSYTFSINSIILFIAIIGSSVLISKIVSFFATEHLNSDNRKPQNDVKGLGSWLLLIRITILTVGLFLALAASGIPIDRIAIVLGALGVGIGFGLQTLVNNLVSGLIIAFEKPVNVGDRVDVDGQSGKVKSIGFRSSIITTWDGADVVMPNGDLLNSHLTNWSLAGNKKRSVITIGIAYNADLMKAQTLLYTLLNNDDRIAKIPKCVIQYDRFNESAIDLNIYFWTNHIAESTIVKSDLIISINNAFSENGIAIPFPQNEVYIHNPNQ